MTPKRNNALIGVGMLLLCVVGGTIGRTLVRLECYGAISKVHAMLNSIPNVQVCDATDDDSSNAAHFIIILLLLSTTLKQKASLVFPPVGVRQENRKSGGLFICQHIGKVKGF